MRKPVAAAIVLGLAAVGFQGGITFGASALAAPILPPATFSEIVTDSAGGSSSLNVPGTVTTSSAIGFISDSASATTVGGVSPSSSASVSSVSAPFASAITHAQAILTYNFEITGPSNINIPVLISGSGFATATFGSSATATLVIARETYNGLGFDSNPLFLQAESCFPACSSGPQFITPPAPTVSVTNFMTTEASNIQLSFMMEAFADVTGSGGSQLAQAFIDPVITIDPSFPDAAAYSIEFSVSPTSAPEPISLVLLATGLVGLHVGRRIRPRG